MAYQEVLKNKLATGYSFEPINCFLLTLKAIFEIIDYFASKDK
jgi:hypothetical protein